MFRIPYIDDRGISRIWRLDSNWTFVIVGAVILLAVVLDQVAHMLQAARRTRAAAAAAMSTPPAPQRSRDERRRCPWPASTSLNPGLTPGKRRR